LDKVRDICLSKYVPSRNIAVDETLLLYKGRIVRSFILIDCMKHPVLFYSYSSNTILEKELDLASRLSLCVILPMDILSILKSILVKVIIFPE
jgi:hypothetical protein